MNSRAEALKNGKRHADLIYAIETPQIKSKQLRALDIAEKQSYAKKIARSYGFITLKNLREVELNIFEGETRNTATIIRINLLKEEVLEYDRLLRDFKEVI